MTIFSAQNVFLIFGHNRRLHEEIITHRRHLYHTLANLTGENRRKAINVLRNMLGDEDRAIEYLRKLSRRLDDIRLNSRQEDNLVKLLTGQDLRRMRRIRQEVSICNTGVLIGTDLEVRTALSQLGLGHIFQSDHILEQRLYEAILDGNVLFETVSRYMPTVQRSDQRFGEVFAIMAPNNELVYYDIVRMLRQKFPNVRPGEFNMPGLYPHLGPGSKTSMLDNLIPHGAEAAYSLQHHFQATRWVLKNQIGLADASELYEYFARDIAKATVVAVDGGNSVLTNQLSRQFRNISNSNRLENDLIRYLLNLPEPTLQTFNPRNFPTFKD